MSTNFSDSDSSKGPYRGADVVAGGRNAERQAAEFLLDMGQALERIEKSSSHYDVLGIEQSAPYERIMSAYYGALRLLFPPYHLRKAVPDETLARMDRAFSKASWAFSILADLKKRAEYHALVVSKSSGAQPAAAPAANSTAAALQAVKEFRNAAASALKVAAPEPEVAMELGVQRAQKQVYSEFRAEKSDDNRRRSQRFKLSLPARISGCDRTGTKWNEMTQSVDVSRTGVTLWTKRRLRNGMVVYLTMPLPVKLRSHGFSDASFNTYALVRRVDPPRKGGREVALEFIGEHPPAGYLEKPWALFRPHRWTGRERRRASRQSCRETVQVEYFNDAFASLGREEAVTENGGKQGMQIRVARAPVEFDLLRVTCQARGFESLAVVRNRSVIKEGVERLCLQFLNNSQRGD